MADHADDTFLDDELEENDFNFDNENEDALLAETDYDLLENTVTAKPLKVVPDNASGEPEEDVLDIGIADEDIVDSETVLFDDENNGRTSDVEANVIAKGKQFLETDCTVAQKLLSDGESPLGCIPSSTSLNGVFSDGALNMELIRRENKENFVDEEQPFGAVCTVVAVSSEMKNTQNKIEEDAPTAVKEKEKGNEDMVSKSRIISLKKSLRKCYDDIPDLAKIIELVQQPSAISSCHNRKDVQDLSGGNNSGLSRKKLGISQQSKRYKDNYGCRKKAHYGHRGIRDNDAGYRNHDDQKSDNNDEDDDQVDYRVCTLESRRRTTVMEDDAQNCFPSVMATTCNDDTILRSDVRMNQPIVASVQITQERYQITRDLHVFEASGNAVMRGALCNQPALPSCTTSQPSSLPFMPSSLSYQPRSFVGDPVTRFSNVVPSSPSVPFAVDTNSNAGVPFTRPLTQQICQPFQQPSRIRLLPPSQQQQQPPLQQLHPPVRPLHYVPSISSASNTRDHMLPVENQQQQPLSNSRGPPPLPPPNSRIISTRIMPPVNFPPPQIRQQLNLFRSPESRRQQQNSNAPSSVMQQFLPSYDATIMRSGILRLPPPMRVPLDERKTAPLSLPSASPTTLMIRQTRPAFRMPATIQNTFVGPPCPAAVAPSPIMPFAAVNSSSLQQPSPFVARSLRPSSTAMKYLGRQRFYISNADVSGAPLTSYNTCFNDDNFTHYVVPMSSSVVSQPPPPGVVPPSFLPVSSSFANPAEKSPHEVQFQPYSNQNYYDTNRGTRAVPQPYNTPETFVDGTPANLLKRTASCSISSSSRCASPSKQARYENVNSKKATLIRNLQEVPIVDTLPSSLVGITNLKDSGTSGPTGTSSSTSKLEVKMNTSNDGLKSAVPTAASAITTSTMTSNWNWHGDITSYAMLAHDEDEDMKVYRRKVEYQKQLREKFVQMKEEQRLKNQMQNFIQNNIKGILQKREQLLRKSRCETESMAVAEPLHRASSSSPSVSPPHLLNTRNSHIFIASTTQPRQSPASIIDSGFNYKISNLEGRCEAVASTIPDRQTAATATTTTAATTGKSKLLSGMDDDNRRQGLHKVLKIKYKDGTVALKSIPVVDHGKSHVIRGADNDDTWSPHHNTSAHHRRMVLSKPIPLPNVNNELTDESVIVESIRKGVTQSSVTLAQRFSNLKSNNEADKRQDEAGSVTKLNRKRLVIPDENESHTVWVKNIANKTSPARMHKMASTCGTVSRTRWISGSGASPKQVKITFSQLEEAKKFCLNFNRKTIDSSLITATILADK